MIKKDSEINCVFRLLKAEDAQAIINNYNTSKLCNLVKARGVTVGSNPSKEFLAVSLFTTKDVEPSNFPRLKMVSDEFVEFVSSAIEQAGYVDHSDPIVIQMIQLSKE